MLALRAAAWPVHQRLEKRLDIKSRFTDLGRYRAHLELMWGFCAALESSLTPESFDGGLSDFETRRKLPLLTRDLLCLGGNIADVALLPRCTGLEAASGPAAAFGCAYVLEGATLGGAALLPMVEREMGVTAERGAAFLASYGAATPSMWTEFSNSLNQCCAAPERQSSAIRAAVATFDALAEWLCRVPA